MGYLDCRTRAIGNVATATINEFLNSYRRDRPTIVVLPGGMGSQLDRSLESYSRGTQPPTQYDQVWADLGTLFLHQALTLETTPNGHDLGDHIIVANGPLRFLINAYDGTERFFRDAEYNYIVFAYDWRRPIAESAAFLEDFLDTLRKRVLAKHNQDPLPNATLLAHSQGGLVAKVFLHRILDVGAWLNNVVTVGTPFYGTWSHQSRYFVGDPLLGIIYSGSEMAPLIATLPGPYNLVFLPRPVFESDGRELGLTRYPIRDADDNEGADPLDVSFIDRYPEWVRKHKRLVQDARLLYKTLSAPLPTAVARRVFNIRSAADRNTPTELVWNELPEGFDPDRDPSPVTPHARGPGDGTVPAWSAWHPSVADENRLELAEALDHGFLLEDPGVLGAVQAVVEGKPLQSSTAVPAEPPLAAAPQQVRKLMEDIAANEAGRDDPRLNDPRMWRGIYRELMR